jgi:hypothetical protein
MIPWPTDSELTSMLSITRRLVSTKEPSLLRRLPRQFRLQVRHRHPQTDSDRTRTVCNSLCARSSRLIRAHSPHRSARPPMRHQFASLCLHVPRSQLRLRLQHRTDLIAMITINRICPKPRHPSRLWVGTDRRLTPRIIFRSTHGLQNLRRKTHPRRHTGLVVTVTSVHVLYKAALVRVCPKTLLSMSE